MTKTNSDTGLLCVRMLAQFHKLAIDPQALIHEFTPDGKPFNNIAVLRSLKSLGFTSESIKCKYKSLLKRALPAIAIFKDGRFVLLGKIDKKQAFLQIPGDDRATVMNRVDFEKAWSGTIITATRVFEPEREKRFGVGWFWQALKKYRGLLAESLSASFFMQLFALVTPLAFQIVIDKVLVHRGLSTLDVIVIGLVLITVFEIVLGTLRTYIFSHTTNRVDIELGAKLFRHMLQLPINYFASRRVGDTVARLRELETVRGFLTGSGLTSIVDLFFTVVFLAVMAYYSLYLTLIVIACIPFFIGVSIVLTPLLKSKLDDKFAKNAENHSFLVEIVSGIETVKSMAAEPMLHQHWEERMAGYVQSAFQSSHLASLTQQGIQLINKALTIALLWYGAKLVIEGQLTVGQLIAFNMLSARITAPILRIANIWQEIQQMRVSLKRLADILDATPEPLSKPGRSLMPELSGAVKFENVSFRYRPNMPEVLKDVSFEVQPGEVIGIVGATGSGKTTVIKLLLRFYVPERGRVLVDGMDLSVIDTSWLRRQIGIVSQDVVLFNKSLRENIVLANPAMDLDHVIKAAVLAGADDFIRKMPEGYDSIVGERGSMLSGGQRQRIAIARALASDPKMIVMDEATSMLDAESEDNLWRNMNEISKSRTVFIITHRLSTLRRVDRIFTLENGELIEQGSPQQLLNQAGRFAQLHKLQLGSAGSIT
ncbi:MAG: Toxin RTX-I translocation ATP-binding protein [Syntrophus sp. SKADARSKE-3]|nr:Toxin RTX-I translocation ATP-binding protein [Syntrophus sp. SKADARSKE-3]